MEIYDEKHLLELAQNGDTDAMLQLGNYYFSKLDFDSTLRWYQKALDYGNNDALIWIARLYEKLDIQNALKNISKGSDMINWELSDTTIEWYEKAFNYFINNYKNNIEYAIEDSIKIDYTLEFECFYYASKYCSKDEMNKFWIQIVQDRLSKMHELGCKQNPKLAKYYRKMINGEY